MVRIMNGLIGKKLGMTQVFDQETGAQVPVTVLQAGPCAVVQVKADETDGYSSIQLGFEDQKEHRVSKPMQGHYAKNKVSPKKVLREFRVADTNDIEVGQEVNVALFEDATHVDVTATSKGRGFQGVVKRYNFGGGRKTHGSHMHRSPGSIGQCVSPARIVKGKKMPGQMGNVQVTTQNLKIQAIREEDGVLLVRGAVPGPTGGILTIRKALKKPLKA